MDEIISQNSSLYLRFLTSKAHHLTLTARKKELDPYEISPPQAYILFLLVHIGHKATLTELAQLTGREINTISLQMTLLEKDGLIKKTRAKTKTTLLCFELTEKGLDIHKKVNEMESDKAIMAVLSEKERQEGILLMKKIISSAERYIIAKHKVRKST